MYEYACIVKRIIDGDTVVLDIDLGFDIFLNDQHVRIHGIDAPESRSSDRIEKEFGKLTTQRVKELLPVGEKFIVKTIYDKTEKYGRILGDLYFQSGDHSGSSLGEVLIREHLAIPYNDNQTKAERHTAHFENRKILISEGKINLPF